MKIRKNIIINVCKLVTKVLSLLLFYDFDKEIDKKIIDFATIKKEKKENETIDK